MSDYKEKFEKMKIAGKLAAKTLDMLTDEIKIGISTDKIDKLGYEYIKDNGGYSVLQRFCQIFMHFIKSRYLSRYSWE